jgi:hypothetical protein
MEMAYNWREKLACAVECKRCHKGLNPRDQRILSSYDHEAICMDCKRAEEKRSDYEEVSKSLIGECLADSELMQSDPGDYCYSHFYPYKC